MLDSKDTLALFFSFKDVKFPDFSSYCYTLKCSTTYTKQSKEELFVQSSQLNTQYCFESDADSKNNHIVKCNPNAYAKIVDQVCDCTYPYKGENCEKCEEKSYIAKRDMSGHTVCVLDDSKCSTDICNNHGECLKPVTKANIS